jgi:hypothetical protein
MNSRSFRDGELEYQKDEELVTVPVAKLQQLVEYGMQVLQESRRKSRRDIEYGVLDTEENERPERSTGKTANAHASKINITGF